MASGRETNRRDGSGRANPAARAPHPPLSQCAANELGVLSAADGGASGETLNLTRAGLFAGVRAVPPLTWLGLGRACGGSSFAIMQRGIARIKTLRRAVPGRHVDVARARRQQHQAVAKESGQALAFGLGLGDLLI